MALMSPDEVEEDETTTSELARRDQDDAAFRDNSENNDKSGSELARKSGKPSGHFSGQKNSLKKKLLIGGGLSGAVISLGIIFFLLLLFKNIHIKNLFIDYEYGKFNKAFRDRLEKSINDPEADPKGTADTTVGVDDSPELALSEASAGEINALKGDPAKLSDALDSATQLDLSPAGTAGIVDPELGITSTLPDETGKSDEEIKKNTNEEIQKEAGAGDQAATPPDNDAVKGAVDETKQALDAGVVSETELQQVAAKGFSSGLNSAVGHLTGPFVYATFLCIARDIFALPGHVVQKMQFKGLANESAYVTKTADCQQQGNPNGSCSLAQQGVVASKFDTTSGGKTQSFTQSCAYVRATGGVAQPNINCTDLNDNLRPSTDLGGIAGTLVHVSNTLDGHISLPKYCLGPLCTPSSIGVPIDTVCGIILNRNTQFVFAGVNIFSAVAAAIGTGPETLGVGDVATAAVESAATIFATKAGLALALDAGLRYSGLDFRRNFDGTSFGNIFGAGTKARAAASCAADGCRQLTQPENTALALEVHSDMVKQQQSKSLAYRLFSPKNPLSTMGLLADKMPASPQTAVVAIGQFFATTLNPTRLSRSFLALINPATPAWAADTEYQTYGIPDYGFTSTELNQWGVVENSRWINNPSNFTADDKTKYDKCFQADLTAIFDPPGYCNAKPGDTEYEILEHYRLYKMDQRVTHDLVLLYNNQPEPGAQTATTPTNTAGTLSAGPIYYVGDSIGEGAKSLLATALTSKGWTPTINTIVGRSVYSVGNGNQTGLQAIDSDQAAVKSAKVVVVELGTNPGGVDGRFQAGVDEMTAKLKSLNPAAQLFWVNIGTTYDAADYSHRNQVLRDSATRDNFTVINWFNTVFPSGNAFSIDPSLTSTLLNSNDSFHPPIHPNATGSQALVDLIISQLSGNTPTSSAAPPIVTTPDNGSTQ